MRQIIAERITKINVMFQEGLYLLKLHNSKAKTVVPITDRLSVVLSGGYP